MAKASLADRLKSIGHSDVVKNTALFDDSEVLNVGIGIPTSIMALNIALSGRIDGGVCPGVHIIAGPSKHFKSLYGLILCKTYMDAHPDSVMLFYDNEFGSSAEYFDSVGIDRGRVIHVPFTDLEELRSDMVKKLDQKTGAISKGDKVIVMVDSLGNAASVKEIEDAGEEKSKADFTRAKTMKSLFRIITSKLRMLEIPFIGINHTYKEMSMYPRDIVSGGCLPEDEEILLSDGTKIPIQNVVPGDVVATIDGPKTVTHSWNPETLIVGHDECYDITMEDESKIRCSRNHPFFIDGQMVRADELKVGDDLEVVEV